MISGYASLRGGEGKGRDVLFRAKLGLCESTFFTARVLSPASYRVLEYSTDTGSGYINYIGWLKMNGQLVPH